MTYKAANEAGDKEDHCRSKEDAVRYDLKRTIVMVKIEIEYSSDILVINYNH